MSWIDDMLDHQRWAEAIEACTDKGVTEWPPVAGVKYKAFQVHTLRRPGHVLGFAIAHREGEMRIVDVVKGDISIPDAAVVCQRYGITKITGAVGDEADALAHAVAGVISELGDEVMQ